MSVLGSWTGARRRRSEDWGVTRITDQIAAWPGLGCGPDPLADFGRECQHGHLRRKCEMCEVLAERTAIEALLRTTAEALRLCQWALREPLDNWKGECERKALDASRAILARLKQEGLA